MASKFEVQRVSITRKATDAERMMSGSRSVTIGFRYRVVAYIDEGMASDGMFSTLKHAALFADETQADKLRDRILAAYKGDLNGLNLQHWIWWESTSCPFVALQQPPTAKEYHVG